MLEDLRAKLKATRLQMLAESQRVLQHESKIYNYERDLERKESLIIKQSLKLDEYQLKYKPG